MGLGLSCEIRKILKSRNSFIRATVVSLAVGIWTLIVCRDVSLLWRISHHPPLTFPLFAVRATFLAMCFLYGIVWCMLEHTCNDICDRRLLAVISQVLFVLWYPLSLLAGIFTLSFISLCFSAVILLIALGRTCNYRSLVSFLRVLMLAVMAYFAYISLGTAPLG